MSQLPDELAQGPEAAWEACLAIIRDNIPRQSYRTWFGPLKAVSLEAEDGIARLTVQLPSQFYYEWLEQHYYALLRKTVAKVLGPTARLYYKVVIERDDAATGHAGTSVNLPARPEGAGSEPLRPPASTVGPPPGDEGLRRPAAPVAPDVPTGPVRTPGLFDLSLIHI